MSSLFIKKKIINCLLWKKNNKFCSEKLFKKKIKTINILNKKCFTKIIFLLINYYIPAFQVVNKTIKIRKLKLIKYKPIFVLENKNKIFFSIKNIVKNSKNKKSIFLNSILINKIVVNQHKIINYKNILIFYRWY